MKFLIVRSIGFILLSLPQVVGIYLFGECVAFIVLIQVLTIVGAEFISIKPLKKKHKRGYI